MHRYKRKESKIIKNQINTIAKKTNKALISDLKQMETYCQTKNSE